MHQRLLAVMRLLHVKPNHGSILILDQHLPKQLRKQCKPKPNLQMDQATVRQIDRSHPRLRRKIWT